MDNKQESITPDSGRFSPSLECKSTSDSGRFAPSRLDCDSSSEDEFSNDSDYTSEDEFQSNKGTYSSSQETKRSQSQETIRSISLSQSQEIKRSQSQDISSSEDEFSNDSDSEWYPGDEPEAIEIISPPVIATDSDGIETTFENKFKASEILGISTANIIRSCMDIRGYEYITVDDKKYSFREK